MCILIWRREKKHVPNHQLVFLLSASQRIPRHCWARNTQSGGGPGPAKSARIALGPLVSLPSGHQTELAGT